MEVNNIPMISKFRGCKIELIGDNWVFCDTRMPVKNTWEEKPCGHCAIRNTPAGHDGCLDTLPGVMNACCGHGEIGSAYVQFLDGIIIRGDSAKIILAELKKYHD